MELYCRRCTRAETIKGDMEAAKAAGWQVDSWPEGDQFVCPRCTPKVAYAKAHRSGELDRGDYGFFGNP